MTTGNLCGKNSAGNLDSLSSLISHAQSSNAVGKVSSCCDDVVFLLSNAQPKNAHVTPPPKKKLETNSNI
jgi:hypothetical protein